MSYILLNSTNKPKQTTEKFTLVSDFRFNGNVISYDFKITTLLNKSYFGVNNQAVFKLAERLEISPHQPLNNYPLDKWLTLSSYLNKLAPKNTTIKDKLLLNINFLYLIKSYKG